MDSSSFLEQNRDFVGIIAFHLFVDGEIQGHCVCIDKCKIIYDLSQRKDSIIYLFKHINVPKDKDIVCIRFIDCKSGTKMMHKKLIIPINVKSHVILY